MVRRLAKCFGRLGRVWPLTQTSFTKSILSSFTGYQSDDGTAARMNSIGSGSLGRVCSQQQPETPVVCPRVTNWRRKYPWISQRVGGILGINSRPKALCASGIGSIVSLAQPGTSAGPGPRCHIVGGMRIHGAIVLSWYCGCKQRSSFPHKTKELNSGPADHDRQVGKPDPVVSTVKRRSSGLSKKAAPL